jgi:rod shape determining protein RodA
VRSIAVIGIYFACIATVLSVDFVVNKVLQAHQRTRIMVLFDPETDPRGAGYNVKQSKIAIGSGEFIGKGFLQGTQTKLKYVPEQSTDFIFCTIGEEHGWIGSTLLIILYIIFMMRLIFLAERQRDRFAKIYGYCVACIFFMHFMINIGMTIGIFPVIGIPLPFFSYGGSSLWSFTILLFIFLKLDAHRKQVLGH